MKVLPKINVEDKIVELDVKDKTILACLIKNVRLPAIKIAKIARLKRETVQYRIDRLFEKRVITATRTALSIRKIGLQSYHIFLEIPDFTEQSKHKIVEKLEGMNEVNAAITYSGKLNLELGLLVRNANELKRATEKILSQVEIKEYKLLILTDTIKAAILPDFFFKGLSIKEDFGKNDTSFHGDFAIRDLKKEAVLDEKDKALLNLISKDALFKIKDLAAKVKISEETAASRLKKLINDGIIFDFRPAINYYALGYSLQTFLIRLTSKGHQKLDEITREIKNEERIIWAVHTVGEWDVMFYILSKSTNEFHEFASHFKSRFNELIKDYETLFAYEEYKYTFYPTLNEKG